MSLPSNFLTIDEEGFPVLSGLRVTDEDVGAEIFENLKFAKNGAFVTTVGGELAYVEAFDEPFVAAQVFHQGTSWQIELPYSVRKDFQLEQLSLDDWDRFHGLTREGMPFVFSRKAQAEFFRLLDDYDDDSITADGRTIPIPNWMQPEPPVHKEEFWSNIYRTETPGWELNEPAPALKALLPQLKLTRSRVLVLGCGSGNDAAIFANGGHIVTAVDISPEALARARQKYGSLSNLTFVQSDLFELGEEYSEKFDLIFEHTCYCAVAPDRRNDLVGLWRRLLAPQGKLLGIFFAMEKRTHPPFGGTEWELRERLKKYFRFLYWNRWRGEPQSRRGKELVILAEKISGF